MILQVVPPVLGGVQDYAYRLHQAWTSQGQQSSVLPLSQEEARRLSLSARLGNLERGDAVPMTLLVNFSGYGYDGRGLCGWLTDEIANAASEQGRQLRVVAMFHELFASGPVWKSAFWLSRTQARTARRLARLCDHVLTNTSLHATWLRSQVRPSVAVDVWPVFSNVGEPSPILRFDSRRPRLVILGSQSTRERALRDLHRHVGILEELGVEEVVEVGPGKSSACAPFALPIRFMGRLETDALSGVLEQSKFGLLVYSEDTMGKSGVFAAYSAHGCVTLNSYPATERIDGLIPGAHYLTVDRVTGRLIRLRDMQDVSDKANGWYKPHSLNSQAAAIAGVCRGPLVPVRRED